MLCGVVTMNDTLVLTKNQLKVVVGRSGAMLFVYIFTAVYLVGESLQFIDANN
jgi:hypothetical protein